jgi:hypothetical protein
LIHASLRIETKIQETVEFLQKFPAEIIGQLVKSFDTNSNGILTINNLYDILQKDQIHANNVDTINIYKLILSNKADGVLTLNDFRKFLGMSDIDATLSAFSNKYHSHNESKHYETGYCSYEHFDSRVTFERNPNKEQFT